jgi:hypothetical protein
LLIMFSSVRSLALASLAVLGSVNAATLSVSTTGGNASSPLLYGLMFEVFPLSPSSLPSRSLTCSPGHQQLWRRRNPRPTPPKQRLPRHFPHHLPLPGCRRHNYRSRHQHLAHNSHNLHSQSHCSLRHNWLRWILQWWLPRCPSKC